MQQHCDGCGERMTVEHAVSCKKGGLVHMRHDDVAQEFGYLCGKAYKPSRVTYEEPLINSRRDHPSVEYETAQDNKTTGGDRSVGDRRRDATTELMRRRMR